MGRGAANAISMCESTGSEFTAWRWMRAADLIDCVVEFRRGPYAQVLGSDLG